MSQVVGRIRELDNGAQEVRPSGDGDGARRMRLSKQLLENGGVTLKKTAIHAKLDISGMKDDCTVFKPELLILLRVLRHFAVIGSHGVDRANYRDDDQLT